MTFEDLCELRSRPVKHLNEHEIQSLLDEAWKLRILINVLECTLKCWWAAFEREARVRHTWLINQHGAAQDALTEVDGEFAYYVREPKRPAV